MFKALQTRISIKSDLGSKLTNSHSMCITQFSHVFLKEFHSTPHASVHCHKLEKPLISTTQMNTTQDQKDFYMACDVVKVKVE